MKKPLILFTLFSFLVLGSNAQETSAEKDYKNEFGVEVTTLMRSVLSFSAQQYPSAPHFLSYRRHLGNGNIRAGLGGDYTNTETPRSWLSDTSEYLYMSYDIRFRIGYEWYSELGKRWQVFYGADFRPRYQYYKNAAESFDGFYTTGSEMESWQYALAPVLGFRFRITDRLSLLTEASLSITLQESLTREYYMPSATWWLPREDEKHRTTRLFTDFSQPLSVFLVVDL